MLNYALTSFFVVHVLAFHHATWMTFLNYCGQSHADVDSITQRK